MTVRILAASPASDRLSDHQQGCFGGGEGRRGTLVGGALVLVEEAKGKADPRCTWHWWLMQKPDTWRVTRDSQMNQEDQCRNSRHVRTGVVNICISLHLSVQLLLSYKWHLVNFGYGLTLTCQTMLRKQNLRMASISSIACLAWKRKCSCNYKFYFFFFKLPALKLILSHLNK
jgi:hypothetical protein